MFKKFLPALVLASFLAVLMLPTITFGAFVTCSSSCSTKVTTDCLCGSTPINEGERYCYNDVPYDTSSACRAAAGTDGGTSLTGDIPGSTKISNIDDIVNIVNDVVGYVFAFVLAVAAIFVIMAGFNFMTAAGDETKIKKARTFLTNALIGVAIAIGVKGLMLVIANLIGVQIGGFLDF